MKRTLVASTLIIAACLVACNKTEEPAPHVEEMQPPVEMAPAVNQDSINRVNFVKDSIRVADSIHVADSLAKAKKGGKTATVATKPTPAKDGPMTVSGTKKNKDGTVSTTPTTPAPSGSDMQVSTKKKKKE